MESRVLQVLILFGILFSCSTKDSEPLSFDTSLLKNGDLMYRYGNGIYSKYFRKISDSVQLYSHVGFVHITEDSIHVIHSEASELSFVGYVRREPLNVFLKDVNAWGLYRLDRSDSIRNRVIDLAYNYHLKRVPFDMDFSITDDKALYCTELIAKCINVGVGSEIVKPATVIMGKSGYSVDDTFLVEGIFEVARSEQLP